MTWELRCPVCGKEALELAEQQLVATVDEEGIVIPGAPKTTQQWFECPDGHARMTVRIEETP